MKSQRRGSRASQQEAPAESKRPVGRFPKIEAGLVRIFGRPWGGSKGFLPSTDPKPGTEKGGTNDRRAKKRLE